MKIIHGNDFYDGAGWGVDETAVFLRQKAKRLVDLDHIEDHPFSHSTTIEFQPDKNLLSPFIVVIAGEIHPGLHHHVPSDFRYKKGKSVWCPAQDNYIYNAKEALALFDRLKAAGKSHYGLIYDSLFRKDWREGLRQHFELSISKQQTEWLLDNKIVLLHTFESKSSSAIHACANHALLKELAFYKCMDPATVHMRLSNYITGVLPNSRDIVTLGNTDRIRKAGFDIKKSFRKAPQK